MSVASGFKITDKSRPFICIDRFVSGALRSRHEQYFLLDRWPGVVSPR
jgi:hypothetical protein